MLSSKNKDIFLFILGLSSPHDGILAKRRKLKQQNRNGSDIVLNSGFIPPSYILFHSMLQFSKFHSTLPFSMFHSTLKFFFFNFLAKFNHVSFHPQV